MRGNRRSFKVYLRDQAGRWEEEVRRFVVDWELRTSLVYIREKFVTVFPVLQDRVFSLSWTDEDSDVITIDSDEELVLALAELTGPVYKLTAIIKGTKLQQTEEDIISSSLIINNLDREETETVMVCGQCWCLDTEDWSLFTRSQWRSQSQIIPFPVWQETGNGIILAYLSTKMTKLIK